MSEYYTPPDPPDSGARARSALIKEIIDSIDDGFDNLPEGLQATLDNLNEKWVEEMGFPTLDSGKFLTNDGVDLLWEKPLPDQATHTDKILTTDGTVASWTLHYPDQSTHDGKVLTTDGTTVSWALAIADQADNADKVLSTNGTTTVWVDRLPDQGSSSGLFLTTDGTDESWASPFPAQATHADKVLKTDGSTTSWTARLPDQAGNADKVLSTNGTSESWVDRLPDQTSNNGLFLQTNGTAESWASPFPVQTSKDGYTLQTDGTNTYWIDLPRTGSFIATADGAITQGRTVVLNNDGTVTQVAGGDGSPGSPAAFSTNTIRHHAVCYDSTNDKVVIVYSDNSDSGYGKAVVGTISGSTITYGTTVTFNTSDTDTISCCFADGVVFIAYRDDGALDHGYAIAGTVSGTGVTGTITFGTAVAFTAAAIDSFETTCVYDVNADRVIIGFEDDASGKMQVVVATLTGTAIAFYGATQDISTTVGFSRIDSCYDPTYLRTIFVVSHPAASVAPVGAICVVTGDEVAVIHTSSAGTDSSGASSVVVAGARVVYDTVNSKVIMAHSNDTQHTLYSKVITVNAGTTLSYSENQVIKSVSYDCVVKGVYFDTSLGKPIVLYHEEDDSGHIQIGTVSGTTVTWTSPAEVVASGFSEYYSAAAVTDGVLTVAYNTGAIIVDYDTTAFDWIGLAHETVTTGASVIINSIGSINDKQTELTPGATYYVDVDGDLTTGTTSYGEIGRALSATELLITKGGME